jgi:hypothetical protein
MRQDETNELEKMFSGLKTTLNQRFDTTDNKLEKISKDIESIERVTRFRESYENIDKFAKQIV